MLSGLHEIEGTFALQVMEQGNDACGGRGIVTETRKDHGFLRDVFRAQSGIEIADRASGEVTPTAKSADLRRVDIAEPRHPDIDHVDLGNEESRVQRLNAALASASGGEVHTIPLGSGHHIAERLRRADHHILEIAGMGVLILIGVEAVARKSALEKLIVIGLRLTVLDTVRIDAEDHCRV